ncbi:pre-RNA processing PIH1/Nop17-domain-containing protein [Zygosaccharomyces rouxii]|nr:pre-RNA processing PIH1/Nop17-domain-containing protein [Zygosaccharomyces rouxii]
MNFFLKPQDNLSSVVTINPKPEFVIKSKLVSTKNRPKDLPELQIGTKVFINLCHDEQVPQPDINFDPAIVYPLIINDQWEIPIITSSMRQDTDKKGALCYVWDCCINTKCAQWIRKEYQLREIVVEWCLESCDLAELLEISRDDISFPKMKSKGPILPLEMLSEELNNDYKKEMAKMVEEGRDEPDNLIKMRRSLMDDEEKAALEEKELPPLFPINNHPPASNAGKPLIEEIDELSINEKGSKPLRESQNWNLALTTMLHTMLRTMN